MAGLILATDSTGLAFPPRLTSSPRQSDPIQIAAQSFTLMGGPSSSSLWYVVDDGGTSNGLPDSSGDCQTVDEEFFGVMIDNAEFSSGPGRAFDQAGIWLNNQVFTSTTIITTPQTLTAGPMPLAGGISATLEYYAASDSATLRTLVSFQNPTASTRPVTATLAVNFGSDAQTVYLATSDGNTIATENDRWIVTSDGVTTSTNAVNTTVLAGPFFPPVTPGYVVDDVFACPGVQTAGVLTEYQFSLPPNSTRRLMLFNQINQTNASALAATAMFVKGMSTLDSDLIAGLGQSQWGEVVNWPQQVETVYLPLIRR
jgi:hypothetical protein